MLDLAAPQLNDGAPSALAICIVLAAAAVPLKGIRTTNSSPPTL